MSSGRFVRWESENGELYLVLVIPLRITFTPPPFHQHLIATARAKSNHSDKMVSCADV